MASTNASAASPGGNLPLHDLTNTSAYTTSFIAGVALHLFIFRVGEWDIFTNELFVGAFTLDALAAVLLHRHTSYEIDFTESLKTVSWLMFLCVGGIFTSIFIYRLAFHRLNRFPGPFAARLSNLYITSRSLKNLRLFEEIQELHRRYGDIVRIGPSELSIADPRAFHLIHSNQSPCKKGPWYNILHPVVSLQMVKDRKEHARRRRIWDKGFSSKALRNYEPRVTEYTQQLLQKLEKTTNAPLDMAAWFNFYSFDVMGDLAFGQGFDMLKDGVAHDYMKFVHSNMLAIGAFSHLIWLFPLFKSVPILNGPHKNFQVWLYEHVRKRIERGSDVKDVFSWILDDYNNIQKPSKQDVLDLHGDAELIVVAGSDTTAATLTCLFLELASNPQVMETLKLEIDKHFETCEESNFESLSKLEYLQACINETLRLHPPVPSGVQRMTPPEGLKIEEAFIPGNTIVQIPSYSLHHDERIFPQPNDFIPERWTVNPELVTDASVFAPFSTGRYSCVGKQLALMEIRQVTTSVIRSYDFSVTPEERDKFERNLKDGFTLTLPPLQMTFNHRTDKQG